jgi:hypothetical protein
MNDAADAAANWVALIDAGEVDASVAAMTETFRSQVSPDWWRGLVAQHRASPQARSASSFTGCRRATGACRPRVAPRSFSTWFGRRRAVASSSASRC